MRTYPFPLALLAGAVALAAGAANDPFSKSQGVIDVAVYGDAPYGTTPTDTSETVATPAFIQAVNAADPQFVVHVGDIHSGKQFCTSAYDQLIYQLWTAYDRPLVYTPGDNEWTDCNKAGEGGGAYNGKTGQIDYVLDANGNPADYAKGDPLQNLALIRSLFFADTGHALGAARKLVLSQAQAFDPAHPGDAQFVENVMWEQSNVLFVTLNLPGGSNNDQDVWYAAPGPSITDAQIQEVAGRTDADIHWLDAAFARAKQDGVVGVVIIIQADMWDPEKGPAHQRGFEGFYDGIDPARGHGFVAGYNANRDIVGDIAKQVGSFGGTVLLFNGDSHVFRSDNPLVPGVHCVLDPGSGLTATACPSDDWLQHAHDYQSLYGKLTNFHRVVVHGSTFPLEWLKLTINPRAHAAPSDYAIGPFSWQRMSQPQ
jgi:hypothetical protein